MPITGASNLTSMVDAVNMHSEDLQGLKADVAVLIDAVLRKDAEADALRAWIVELEARIVSLETSQVRTYTTAHVPMWPITSSTFKLTTTTDGTDDGNVTKL